MRLAHRLDTISFFVLLATTFLLPLALLPTTSVPLQLTKFSLLSLGVMVALALWAIARLNEHRVSFPNTVVLWSALALVAAHGAAALLSDTVGRSLIGFGFERDTTLALFVFVSAFATVALIARSPFQTLRLQQTMLASFLIFGLLHVVRLLVGADVFFPGIFSSDQTATLLGSWNDLAVFGGLSALLAISSLMLSHGRRLYRLFLYAVTAVALFFLALVNLTVAWVALLVCALLLMVYVAVDASYHQEQGVYIQVFPVKRLAPGIVVVLISILFLIAGNAIGNRLTEALDVAYLDVRPSWQATIDVGSAVYEDSWITGAGPNLFSRAWVQNKPVVVNETAFWNVDFAFGIGFVPTLFVSGGIVVGAALVVFFGAFLLLGARILIRRPVQPEHMFIALSSYLGAAYLLVLTIVYVPQIVMLSFAFVLAGAAVAAASAGGVIATRELSAEAGYTQGIALTFGLLAVGLLSVGALLTQTERVYATATLNRAVVVANEGDLGRATAIANRAAVLGSGVRAEQLKANIGLARVAEIINRGTDEDIEAQRAEFQAELASTIRAAQSAVNIEPGNYNNWLLLADIYAQLVPLEIDGAYENAVTAYEEAQKRNATNPLIPVSLARLALDKEELDTARTHVQEALALKTNYTDAFFILSQIEIRAGNTAEAIRSTESAVVLRPDNAGLLFQLGLLYYSNQEYENAVLALNQALTINEDYANALYFLGLSYDRLGSSDEALKAFEHVARLNPDNVEVQNVVAALQAGESAFSALETQEEAPINRDELPVSEE